jgi:hypothetical protein
MEDISRKRSSLELDDATSQSLSKRQRTTTLQNVPTPTSRTSISTTQAAAYEVTRRPTAGSVGRDGLRRSITLALGHVGFDSATEGALEGFTETVETCWCFH